MSDIYDGETFVTGGEGPQGQPAAQDIALGFSNGYHALEVLDGAVIKHATTIKAAGCYFRSLTAPTVTVTFPIRKNAVAVGHADMDPLTCGAGPVFVGTVTLTADLALAAGDLVDWTAPGTVDATFTRGDLTLGSYP